ncbi:MAG: hypothetical protein ACRD2O_15035 [Terriglobia bacterium]
MAAQRKKNGDSGFYEPYIRYSGTLRSWFVAYGIGVPVLLVSQNLITKAIIKSGTGNLIASLFLVGVAIQVIATFLYKYSQEYLYHEETGAELEGTTRLAIAKWLSNAVWFEMLLDILSITLFVCGTFAVVAAVLAPA